MKNKLKKLFSPRKKRKKKSLLEIPAEKKAPKQRFRKFLAKIQGLFKKYPEQIKAFKKFIFIIVGYGLIINYALYFIFRTRFSIFSLLAWGIAYYFISDEFVEWFRRLISKR